MEDQKANKIKLNYKKGEGDKNNSFLSPKQESHTGWKKKKRKKGSKAKRYGSLYVCIELYGFWYDFCT